MQAKYKYRYIGLNNTPCLKKRHCFGLLYLWLALSDFDNFWKGFFKKVKSQMVLYFLHHLTSAFALPGKAPKHENRIFTQMLHYCCSGVELVAAWFLQFGWLETHIYAGIDFRNLVINWVRLWPVGTVAQEKWSWEFCPAAVEQCCAQHALVHAWTVRVAERQIILSTTTRLITANICWDSKISHQYCPFTFFT